MMRQIIQTALLFACSYAGTDSPDIHHSYEAVAHTNSQVGRGVPVALGRGPSINDLGQVAFVARDDASQRGRVVLQNGNTIVRDFVIGPPATVSGSLQVNNAEQIVFRQGYDDGLVSHIQRLDTGGGGCTIGSGSLTPHFTAPFDFVAWWPAVNNQGLGVFAADIGIYTVLASRTSGTGEHGISGALTGFPNLFPMVSDTNATIVRWGSTPSSPIYLFTNELLNSAVVVADNIGFTEIGEKPGISDDGKVGVFCAKNTVGEKGVYLAVFAAPDVIYLARAAVLPDSASLDFRVGVNQSHPASQDDYTVVFLSRSHTTNIVGLYSRQVSIRDPACVELRPTTLLAELGSTIDKFVITVREIDIYDPVNRCGEIVFWIQTDNFQAIIKATADSDGDGLLDPWECQDRGIDIDDDGNPDYDRLASLGAHPLHKDVFVEVDVMDTVTFPETVRDQLVKAFADAPVANPDGKPGINLHIQIEPDDTPLEHREVWPVEHDWLQDYCECRDSHFGTDAERDAGNSNLLEAKKRAFRYCLICDRASDGVPGKGRVRGSEFFVAGGHPIFDDGYLDDEYLAATFMHELGHTLGLQHGGLDNINGKPNYISVMNSALTSYAFESPVPDRKPAEADSWQRLDYSRGGLNDLREDYLDEVEGVYDRNDYYTGFTVPYAFTVTDPNGQLTQMMKQATIGDIRGTDWNGDGHYGGICQQDLNHWPVQNGDLSIASPNQDLVNYNDWENLAYPVRPYLKCAD